jgi:hypothetical protein
VLETDKAFLLGRSRTRRAIRSFDFAPDEHVESPYCPNPQRALAILIDRGHDVAAQARWVVWIVPVVGEGSAPSIQPVQPGDCADPQIPPMVFVDRQDGT